jgi:ABC-type multidrug transport system ATPase subunit
MTSDVLLTRGVHYSYKGREVLFDITLNVCQGDIFGVLGPNGAGKTTLIKCILGLLPNQSGTISVFGETGVASRKKNVGSLVETPSFILTMTAKENLELAQLYGGEQNPSMIDEVLKEVQLFERREDPVQSFSLGMKQRLGIARALLNDPKMLILDEPTNGLDPKGMNDIRMLIRKLNEEKGITIIVSSHLLHEIEQVSNRICIIDDGKLIFQGKTQSLQDQEDEFWINSENRTELKMEVASMSCKIISEEEKGLRIQLSSMNIGDLNRELHNKGISLTRIEPVLNSLEASFLQLTEGNQ